MVKLHRSVYLIATLSYALCFLFVGNTFASTYEDIKRQEAGFYAGADKLSTTERAGREIWYKAAAGNDRFHTYVFQQRLGVLIDWFRVLRGDQRNERFNAWGLINDPSCCVPGSKDCPAKSYEETYGFDFCPGDEELLKFVGKQGYRDPACDFDDVPLNTSDIHGPEDKRQSACDLKFGTSTGTLGLRKFPNPKFNKAAWLKLNNGKQGTWEGYNKKLSQDKNNSDSTVSHLLDASIEPPFTVGMACGACHIAFNPLNPPIDTANPKWENIIGAIGNQYARLSEVMVSGMHKNSLEWQVFAHARPGTTDTSAVPTDQVNNPGTMNALINLADRPVFAGEKVIKWRKTKSCPANVDEEKCWCEPGKAGKCWEKSLREETVHHVLKGGGDSIGVHQALQRVFINTGSCSEACWVNHLTDLRQLDPQQRNYGQTPFDIGQCRRDCPNFRAVEDRIESIGAFLFSKNAASTDLLDAKSNQLREKNINASYVFDDLVDDLEKEFGQGTVSKGKVVFAKNCARCHSSQKGAPDDFKFQKVSAESAVDANNEFFGNEISMPASEVGTFRCRALHSNHMKNHVWEEFASETYRERKADSGIKEKSDGGRGYYRNISLVNLWAHAPFMHNNAVGPELCGKTEINENEFYRSPYVDEKGEQLNNSPACFKYDPSVEGRFNVYKASMDALLNPEKRKSKITLLDEDIILDIGPKLWDGKDEKKVFGLTLRVPKGTNAGLLGNFLHKEFIVDLVLAKTDPKKLEIKLVNLLGQDQGKKVTSEMKEVVAKVIERPADMLKIIKTRLPVLLDVYSSCTGTVENAGHRFGEDLSDQDKQALTAFLATI